VGSSVGPSSTRRSTESPNFPPHPLPLIGVSRVTDIMVLRPVLGWVRAPRVSSGSSSSSLLLTSPMPLRAKIVNPAFSLSMVCVIQDQSPWWMSNSELTEEKKVFTNDSTLAAEEQQSRRCPLRKSVRNAHHRAQPAREAQLAQRVHDPQDCAAAAGLFSPSVYEWCVVAARLRCSARGFVGIVGMGKITAGKLDPHQGRGRARLLCRR